jgi:integrase
LIDANPFHRLSIRPPQDAQTTADGDDIEALIQTASRQADRRRAASDVAIVALATTGCRRGELAAVTVRDVDLTSGVLHLPVSKTRTRVVPLTDRAIVALSRWMRRWSTGAGNLRGVQHPEQLITKTVRTLSGGRLTPHSLRRAFAVSWLSQGGRTHNAPPEMTKRARPTRQRGRRRSDRGPRNTAPELPIARPSGPCACDPNARSEHAELVRRRPGGRWAVRYPG